MKQPIEIVVNPTTPEYQRFEDACRRLYETHMKERFPSLECEAIIGNFGSRYVKICKVANRNYGGSVWIFVDRTNGDVLKPASWNAPAKHARGNIFAADNGMGCIGVYGVAYLR
jgi:hypothetical protein